MYRLFCLLIFSLLANAVSAQQATLYGQVTDMKTTAPIEFAYVIIKGTATGTQTDENGKFEFSVPANEELIIEIRATNYESKEEVVSRIRKGKNRKLNVALSPSAIDLETATITENAIDDNGQVRENVENLGLLPSTTGNIESMLPQIAVGVTSGTGGELSSQYSVRGGSYDENLVYVNDFEVYRPQLIRAGQQEGLTFPNIDLIKDLSFSSGGFDARYGDKMSSVLDIKYKRPDSVRTSLSLSALGATAHTEGSLWKNKKGHNKLRYLVGARYKTTQYLLSTLDVEGEYVPNFYDIQTYITYDINKHWNLGYLANYNRSEYKFKPASRETAFGLVNFALQLRTVFEGQERDDFTNYMNGLSLTYLPEKQEGKNHYYLKFLASTFQSNENERIDITGHYLLGQLETGLGENDFGEIVAVLGTGTEQDFVRNYLQYNVTNLQHKGGLDIITSNTADKRAGHFIQWGAKFQQEVIDDEINEWERLDSAGYSLPYTGSQVLMNNVYKSKNNLSSNRYSAYVQDAWTINDSIKEIKWTVGVRAQYWDRNEELIVSPRTQILFKPKKWNKDVSIRLAAGMYSQAPFYREMRRLDGSLNYDLKAQKSLHVVLGGTYDFNLGKNKRTPFRLIAEAYYKHLWDLVSYELDNVRIRYSGENDATGYVAGLDLRLNGEFVPGAESWVNLSFLQAKENLTDVQHKAVNNDGEVENVNFVPRPTDQLFQIALFFQDYLPKNENFKMHMNLTIGTGWPFGIPDNNREFRNAYRFDAYHRIDVGFSAQLWNENWRKTKKSHPLRFTRNTWLSLEVFNLMEVSNEASNTWIKTVTNQSYAVPNYLTSRRVNLRLKVEF